MYTQPQERPVLDEAVSDALNRQYGLEIQSARQYRKIWQLETSTGTKYLKKTKLNPDALRFIHEALEHLERQGFNQAPRFWLNLNGEPFIQTGSDLYVLTDWYHGLELNFQVLMDLKQACQLLANFHLASRGFEPSCPDLRTDWLGWPAKLEQRIRELQEFRNLAWADKDSSSFSRLYLRLFEPFYRQANLSYQWLLDSPYPQVAEAAAHQRSFCHHDYSGRNLLRTYDQQLILVDFDYCLRDIRIHDLINLLVRNLKHADWRNEIGRFILTEYHQTAPFVPEELVVMQILLSWPQDFWQIGLQYYKEKLVWPPERFLKKLEHRIGQRFERERFCKEFPEQNGVFRWKSELDLGY